MRLATLTPLLLAAAAATALSDQGGTPRAGPPPSPDAVVRNNGTPRPAPLPKAGPPLNNSISPVVRLYRATPEQRERVLEKLPPHQQEQLRKELERFDSLPDEQKQQRIEQAERFEQLTPDQRTTFRQQLQKVRQLGPLRQRAVAGVLRRLQEATDEERAEFLEAPRFRNRFTPEEQQIIRDLTAVMPSRGQ
jgi:hypothetical protein